MSRSATCEARQECRSIRRGQKMTVAGVTVIPLGGDRFRVIAPVGCRIDVEPVDQIDVESAATSHPSDRREP